MNPRAADALEFVLDVVVRAFEILGSRTTACYSADMDREALREFARRNHADRVARKQAHWAEAAFNSDGEDTMRAGHLLFEHARQLDANYPSVALRKADFEHHLRLKALIDRVADKFRL